jgi:hypothetical protein
MRNQFTQQSMPEQHRDTHKWPPIDVSRFSLEERLWIERRQRSIRAYVEGQPLAAVCREYHQTPSDVMRLFRNALVVQPDGTIYGWRTLLPHSRQKDYKRFAKPKNGSLRQAAASRQLLIDRPHIAQTLESAEHALKIQEIIGCAINWGSVKHGERRPLIEALFSSIERSAFRGLPNTTGTGPEDPLRPEGAAAAEIIESNA